MARKSLTSGLNFEDDKAPAKGKGKGGRGDEGSGAPTGKIVLISICFLLGGLGLAYNFGLFEGKPKHAGKPVNPQGESFTPEVQKSIDNRAKRLELPEGNPSRPVTGAS